MENRQTLEETPKLWVWPQAEKLVTAGFSWRRDQSLCLLTSPGGRMVEAALVMGRHTANTGQGAHHRQDKLLLINDVVSLAKVRATVSLSLTLSWLPDIFHLEDNCSSVKAQ